MTPEMKEGPVSAPLVLDAPSARKVDSELWTLNLSESYRIDRLPQLATAVTLADTGPALRRLHAGADVCPERPRLTAGCGFRAHYAFGYVQKKRQQ